MKNLTLKLSLYAMVFGVAWSFIWSQLLLNYGLVLLVMIGLSWYIHPFNIRYLDYASKVWSSLTVLFLVYFVISSMHSSYIFMRNIQQIIIFVLFYKLCNLQQVKDAYHIILVCFVALLSSFSWNFEAAMVYPFVMTLVFITVSMIQLGAYSKATYLSEVNTTLPPRNIFMHGSLVMLGCFLFAGLVFLMVPRTTLGYFEGLQLLNREYLTGFSYEVGLGDLNSIKRNTDIAFRVKLNRKMNTDQMYWRGVALDEFDNFKWRNTSAFRMFYIVPNKITMVRDASETVEQKIYNTAIENKYLFHLTPLAGMKLDRRRLLVDENDNLMSSAPMYYMYSLIGNSESVTSLSSIQKQKYLQLPTIDQQIYTFNDRTINKSKPDYQKALALVNYLKLNYQYSVDVEDADSENPLLDFLLYRKKGHCEYYASALCVLLRLNNIPCRVVNGFLGAEYNVFGDYYIVRQSNAHSWVEAYFAEKGWTLLDATPAGNESLQIALVRWLSTIGDSVNFLWENYVLLYSFENQLEFYRSFVEWLRSFKEKTGEIALILPGFPSKAWILIIIFAMAGFVALKWFRHAPADIQLKHAPDYLFYRLFLVKMYVLGFRKKSSMTPLEFFDLLQDSPHHKQAAEVTRRYCRLKYGRPLIS